jgi:hypothetical protein
VTVEKDSFGRFLHDITYVFAEVSVPALPALLYVLVNAEVQFFGVKSGALFAWMGLTVTATLVRGGWVKPLLTEVQGWVRLTPSLVVLRLLVFNGALVLGAYGTGVVATAVGLPFVVPVLATAIGVLTAVGFPRLSEVIYETVSAGGR